MHEATIEIFTNNTEGMSKEQVIQALKDILLSNDFDGKKEQENELIIANAEYITKEHK